MTILRRNVGLLLALSATLSPQVLAAPAVANPGPLWVAQDLSAEFQEGVQLLNQGRKEEALVVFQRILASDPSNEAAYELWKEVEHQVWIDLLTEGGDFELVAGRIIERAELQMMERKNDAEAIRELVTTLRSTDSTLERRRAIDKLAAEHGEYAVPYLLPALDDGGDDDWRVMAMLTLTRLGHTAVLPLLEALDTDNAFLRRNVIFTLGNIGDPRAAGPLAAVAATDPEETVASAARDAAAKCGLQNGDGLAALLRDGDDYHYRRGTVMAPYMQSNVVWSWDGSQLVSQMTNPSIYANELSKKAYYRALALAPDSREAHAGVARACLDIQARIDAMAEAGMDVSELQDKSAEGALAVAVAGPDALDLALQWAVLNDDATTGTLLCNALANAAKGPTAGLISALDAPDGGVRGEAAVALGRIAIHTKQAPDARVIDALGQNAGREVVRIATLIDGDAARAAQVTEALTGRGVMVNHRGDGAKGLAMLNRIPNVDIILVGDSVTGMTADRILSWIAERPVLQDKPVFFLSQNEEIAEAYSGRVAGVVTDLADMSALDSVFEAGLDGDRAQADRLAAHSAETLAALAAAGQNIGGTLGALASTLAHRPDAVSIPSMHALGLAGTSSEVAGLLAVLTDGERSDEARTAAGDAIAGILGRHNVDGDAIDGLRSVFDSDASLAVRQAAGRALGRFALSSEERAELIRRVRTTVAGS